MHAEKTFDFKKAKLFYRVIGEGATVVLLHGVPADGNLWRNQFELAGFKLIVPDLPGSGKSQLIEDASMEGMAEAILAMIHQEEISTACLIGHSMGGYISLAFADKHPEFLTGLGLFHSTAYPDSEERKQIRRKGIEFIRKNGAGEFLRTSIPNLFAANNEQKNAALIEELVAKTNNFSPQALVSYYEAMLQRPDRTNILEKSGVPVLFIAGKSDSVIPLADSLKQCHLPERSYFHLLSQSGHMGMLEEPQKTNSILNDYLLNLS